MDLTTGCCDNRIFSFKFAPLPLEFYGYIHRDFIRLHSFQSFSSFGTQLSSSQQLVIEFWGRRMKPLKINIKLQIYVLPLKLWKL